MKHTFFSVQDVYRSGCWYGTRFCEGGITNYYSVCLGFKKGQHIVEQEHRFPSRFHNCEKEVLMCKVIDTRITFEKTPYKQVRPHTYTQRFRFVKIAVFTPYWAVKDLIDVSVRDMEYIKRYIKECTI